MINYHHIDFEYFAEVDGKYPIPKPWEPRAPAKIRGFEELAKMGLIHENSLGFFEFSGPRRIWRAVEDIGHVGHQYV